MKVVKNRVLSRTFVEMLNTGIAVGVLILGMVLVLQQRWGLTVGDLAAFTTALATTYKPLKTLSRGWARLMDALSSAERFFEILDAPAELPDGPDAIEITGLHEGIRFDRVNYSYDREEVLRDITLDVRANEVVAIVGRTGSGKTTLMDLLLRFDDPQTGSIQIDGVDLRNISRDSFIRQIAVVTQDPFLFDTTIRENISYGRPDATEAEILAAAAAAPPGVQQVDRGAVPLELARIDVGADIITSALSERYAVFSTGPNRLVIADPQGLKAQRSNLLGLSQRREIAASLRSSQ